ncbi:MAG: pyridoxamine 5'-phosphate oxidase family protein [Spirochaetaceae bacterium]|nr:MAG: pyridoxamine 5'-phosphate oxidase family protein [Spirochaetaceae bacterium]
MEIKQMFESLERILEKSKIATLSTIRSNGYPSMRWMTPALLRGQTGFLYAVSSSEFAWTQSLAENPQVEWMIQTAPLQEIMHVNGRMQVIDNPALRADVQEAIGGFLQTFWKNIPDESSLIVLETVIEGMTYFRPTVGEKVSVTIS